MIIGWEGSVLFMYLYIEVNWLPAASEVEFSSPIYLPFKLDIYINLQNLIYT